MGRRGKGIQPSKKEKYAYLDAEHVQPTSEQGPGFQSLRTSCLHKIIIQIEILLETLFPYIRSLQPIK